LKDEMSRIVKLPSHECLKVVKNQKNIAQATVDENTGHSVLEMTF